MAVPPQDELHRPLLEIASEANKELHKTLYVEAVTKRMSLTPEDLVEMIPSGQQTRILNRVDWGLYYLDKAGLLERPSRGHYQITTVGRDYLKNHTGKIKIAQLTRLANHSEPERSSSLPTMSPNLAATVIAPNENDTSPLDKIDTGYRALRDKLVDDLLDSISQISPESFERLVVDLLQKMGYGKGQVVGKSGDRGIDGIVNQDALGLEKVYLQAKRWQTPVGEPEIRNFIGSLVVAEGATKGVFVTNSTFSASARQTAKTTSNMLIRLIDGQELANLMINHDVGIITKYTYKIQSLDENYFSKEL